MKYLTVLFAILVTTLAYAQVDTGYVDCIDAQLFYKVFGLEKDDPIVLINGGPGYSSNYLNDTAQALADCGKYVILFDQRGTGNSTVDSYTKPVVSFSKTVHDIDKLREHLAIKKWDVIGHAYGGALAMIYAQKYSTRVNRLVLSSSIGLDLSFVEPMMANLKLRLGIKEQEELNKLNQEISEGKTENKNFYKQRFDLIADAYVYDKSKLEIARAMHQEENDYVLEVNQLIWDEMIMRDYDITNVMKSYKGKVLIIHGRQDVIGESVPMQTHLTLPNSELVFINKAGRYLWLDQEEEYFNHLTSFLK